MMVEPPGWRAQSKSAATLCAYSGYEYAEEDNRSVNIGPTAASVSLGTRCVKTTFHPEHVLAFESSQEGEESSHTHWIHVETQIVLRTWQHVMFPIDQFIDPLAAGVVTNAVAKHYC